MQISTEHLIRALSAQRNAAQDQAATMEAALNTLKDELEEEKKQRAEAEARLKALEEVSLPKAE